MEHLAAGTPGAPANEEQKSGERRESPLWQGQAMRTVARRLLFQVADRSRAMRATRDCSMQEYDGNGRIGRGKDACAMELDA